MKLLNAMQSFVAAHFGRHQRNAELEEELGSHIQHRADDLEHSGLGRAEAERQARIEFGGREKYRVECSEEQSGHLLEGCLQDLRFAVRSLRHSPGFLAVAVVTLALGIGANGVVFSMLNGLVLRPLNVSQPRSLYTVENAKTGAPMQSYSDYLDLRDRNRSFQGLAAYDMYPAGLDVNGTASPIWLYEASGNYFDMLGVQPYLGRFFHSGDEHGLNSAPYVVLSYAYWRAHFQGDRGVLGRTVEINRHPFTVLGVAPEQFEGTELFVSPALWVPLVNAGQIDGGGDLTNRAAREIFMIGRLKPGVTAVQATADLNSVAAYLAGAYPKDDDQISFTLAKPGLAGDMLGRPVRAFVSGLMLLAGLILLAACANLGSLFAARAADRSREIALRLALGSSRRRILRQLLIEAVLVALVGGVAGSFGSAFLLHLLTTWQPATSFPIHLPVSPDATVYAVSLLLALASGLLFGLVPVRQVLRANPYQVVKSGSSGGRRRRVTGRDLLLVVQITICAVLVTASLVAVRGLVRSLHSNFGFLPQNVTLVDTDLDMAGYSGDRVAIMQRRILEAMKTIPGVTSAGLIDRAPLAMGWSSETVFKDGTADMRVSNAAAEALSYRVSPEYLQAAGTTLLAGRMLTWHDDKDAPRVAVVNMEFARELFGSIAQAVGGYYKTQDGTRIQVVGIAEDGKYKTLTEDPQPAIFRPVLQAPTSASWLVVRSERDPRQMAGAMEDTLRELDSGLPFTLRTWNRELDSALFASRAATLSLGVLGVLGAMLAVTGIFGMASYSLSKRLREMGIRIALGARRGQVLRAALGRVFRLLVMGSVAGLVLGLGATKILAFIVYEATPRDPLVLCGVLVTMVLLGLLAAWIPAQRALAADPLLLLREQ